MTQHTREGFQQTDAEWANMCLLKVLVLSLGAESGFVSAEVHRGLLGQFKVQRRKEQRTRSKVQPVYTNLDRKLEDQTRKTFCIISFGVQIMLQRFGAVKVC